jgi:hypothetical protein
MNNFKTYSYLAVNLDCREPARLANNCINMDVDELRNEALICLHRAKHCCGGLEAVRFIKQAARLIAAANMYDVGPAIILGDQRSLKAA